MPADEYVTMASDIHVLGNPLLKTQHFIGASKWEKVSDTEVIGWHQLRVPHQRYTDETKKEVAVKGHAHGSNQHWYAKVNGTWKFAGLSVEIRWGEFEFEKVFATGEEKFGETEKGVVNTQIATGIPADDSLLPGGYLDKPLMAPENTPENPLNAKSETSTVAAGASTIENMSAEERASMLTRVEANREGIANGAMVHA